MTHDLYDEISSFMSTNPSQDEIELYYCNVVSKYTKDSISEILENYDMGETCRNGKPWDKCNCC